MPDNLGWLLAAFFVPFGLMAVLTPPFVGWLKHLAFGQFIREDGPQSHLAKQGTPTGGGLLMLAVFSLSSFGLAWGNAPLMSKTSLAVLIGIAVVLALGGLGLVDDGLKIFKKKNKGVSGYTKLVIQASVGVAVGLFFQSALGASTTTLWPHGPVVPLGWAYPLFAALVMMGGSNAVNLTDGLDGLAAGTSLLSFLTLALLAYATFGWGVLTLLALAGAGTVAGFLLYNRHPAHLFMGDSGSLALGGLLSFLALALRMEWGLLLIGLVFVIEALSVILQVIWFKRTGKRLFRMAPFHHHLELGGLKETDVVTRLWVLQLGGCLIALSWFLP